MNSHNLGKKDFYWNTVEKVWCPSLYKTWFYTETMWHIIWHHTGSKKTCGCTTLFQCICQHTYHGYTIIHNRLSLCSIVWCLRYLRFMQLEAWVRLPCFRRCRIWEQLFCNLKCLIPFANNHEICHNFTHETFPALGSRKQCAAVMTHPRQISVAPHRSFPSFHKAACI